MSFLVRQRLAPDHAGSEAEAVVHVFGIRAEQAMETVKVDAGSGGELRRVADIAGDIVAADAKSGAGLKEKTIEIRLRRSRCNEPAKGK
jgi:hypothetical protein